MKLILHIGTHKTATTSIQHFCALNRDALIGEGFYYPRNNNSAYTVNFLASDIAFGKADKTKVFFEKSVQDARKNKCETVVMSGESFYAMTGFFIDIQGHDRQKDYWASEASLIEDVKSCTACFDDVEIICYFRPQDELADSLYNQLIKNVFGACHDYEAFLKLAKHLLDYRRHLSLWEETFGQDVVKVKNFAEHKRSVIKDFCASFLTDACFEKASVTSFEANTRLTRDVMEVKKLYNATKPDAALAFVSARSFRAITDQFPDQKDYQIFASLKFRDNFFNAYASGNGALSKEYAIKPLAALSNASEPSYDGLTAEKCSAVYLAFCEDLYSPRNRIELLIRRGFRFIMEKMPGGRAVVAPVQKAHNYLRLRFEGW